MRACVACGGPTEPLYRAAADHYFESGHAADYVVCADRSCRTLHEDPRPSPEEVARFYGAYYTHARLPTLKRIEKTAGGRLQAVLLARYAEPGRCAPLPDGVLASANVPLDVAGIVPGGSRRAVLDVGCGNGESLVMLSAFGWTEALGVETDERACAASRALGFDVRPGTAESLPYEDGRFDAVFLRHVIEHVIDPEKAIREALRVLAPGGLLSFLTPNAAARNHERHRSWWRGLESPRHLHVFTPGSLSRVATRAGAEVLRSGANDRSAAYIDAVSTACTKKRGGSPAGDRTFDVAPEVSRGEEIYLIARKP